MADTVTKTKETDGSAKSGEKTVKPAAASTAASAEPILTAAEATSALMREFAAETPAVKPQGEIEPPAGTEKADEASLTGEPSSDAKAMEDRAALEARALEAGKTVEEIEAEDASAAAAEAAALADESPEGESAPIEGLEPEVQERIDKRIGKVVAQREEFKTKAEQAEARIAELTVEVETLKAAPPTVVPPPAGVLDEKALEELETAHQLFLNDAKALVGEFASPEQAARIEKFMASQGIADKAGLQRTIVDSEERLYRQIPATRQALVSFRQQEASLQPEVVKYFPDLEKKGSPMWKQAQQILSVIPEIQSRTPAHKVALGIYCLGLREFEKLKIAASAKPGANGKVQTPVKSGTPPPKPPAGKSAAPARAPGRPNAETAAAAKFKERPTAAAATDLLKAQLAGVGVR